VIFGTAYDEGLGDQLRVTVIATGLSSVARRAQPPLSVVQQPAMRTGTDNLPIMSQPAQVGAMAAPPQDYSSLSTPSVWRTARSQSAAAKVEALSSNGMDEIEIPAFLRKQAD
jgi:cell division protein FtsZ